MFRAYALHFGLKTILNKFFLPEPDVGGVVTGPERKRCIFSKKILQQSRITIKKKLKETLSFLHLLWYLGPNKRSKSKEIEVQKRRC